MEGKLKSITIKVDEETHRKYKVYLAETGLTFKDIFNGEMERRIAEAKKAERRKVAQIKTARNGAPTPEPSLTINDLTRRLSWLERT